MQAPATVRIDEHTDAAAERAPLTFDDHWRQIHRAVRAAEENGQDPVVRLREIRLEAKGTAWEARVANICDLKIAAIKACREREGGDTLVRTGATPERGGQRRARRLQKRPLRRRWVRLLRWLKPKPVVVLSKHTAGHTSPSPSGVASG